MERAQDFVSNVGENVGEAVTSVQGQLGEVISNKGSTLLGVLLLVGLACIILAYVLYRMVNYVVVNNKMETIPGTQVPVQGYKYSKLNGSGIPYSGNGKRMSMSFWVYINDIDKFSGTPRHVFHRGSDTLSVDSGPVVYLDAETNKLHIILDMNIANAYRMVPGNTVRNTNTQSQSLIVPVPLTAGGPSGLNTDGSIKANPVMTGDDIRFLAAAQGITVDYIPLQRWVHVAIVVNEDFSGGIINAYVDGELVKSVTTGDIQKPFFTSTTAKETVVRTGITNIVLDKRGDVWIGGDFTSSVGPGFSGLVSNMKFFNYDLNVQDVYNLYVQGPINNLLAKLGLPPYGLRSPVYRLS